MARDLATAGATRPGVDPVADGLADLVDKYRLLAALRGGVAGRTDARRAAMREVAARFPGALREWERSSLAELGRRQRQAEAALARRRASTREDGAGGDPGHDDATPDWMTLSHRFHQALRTALAAKRLLAGRPITDDVVAEAAPLFVAVPGVRRGRPWLEAVAAPPGGRLTTLALGEVAVAAGLSVSTLQAVLGSAGEPPAEGEQP